MAGVQRPKNVEERSTIQHHRHLTPDVVEMKSSLLLLSSVAGVSQAASIPGEFTLESLRHELKEQPEVFADKLRNSSIASVLRDVIPGDSKRVSAHKNENSLPLVFMHGMGDSCFNRGMESITESSGEYLGVYSVCIPTGVCWKDM